MTAVTCCISGAMANEQVKIFERKLVSLLSSLGSFDGQKYKVDVVLSGPNISDADELQTRLSAFTEKLAAAFAHEQAEI